MNKVSKYILAIVLFGFYLYIAASLGVTAAVVMFFKVLGIVIFGMAHVWAVDAMTAFGKIIGGIKWSSTSSQEFSQRLLSYFFSPSSTSRK